MVELRPSERLIINRLFDREMFTTTTTIKQEQQAVLAYQRPDTQRRVNSYLRELVGQTPLNCQDNLLFLSGSGQLSATDLRIILATLKAVINSPEQGMADNDGLVACQPIVSTVHTTVPELEDGPLRKRIDAFFVDRFRLFKVRRPESLQGEQEVDEYWDISPDFLAEAQNIVMYLTAQTEATTLTPVQQVNAYLLQHQYLDAVDVQLWATLQANKAAIANQWAQLERYYLECGDDYAMLLDADRIPVKSRAFFVAVTVAQELGSGLAEAQLNDLMKTISARLYPKAVVVMAQVKSVLTDLALAVPNESSYWIATPVATRFEIIEEDTDDQ